MPYTKPWMSLPRMTGPKLKKWLAGSTGYDAKRHNDFGEREHSALLSDLDTFYVAKGKKQVKLQVMDLYDPFVGKSRHVLFAELV